MHTQQVLNIVQTITCSTVAVLCMSNNRLEYSICMWLAEAKEQVYSGSLDPVSHTVVLNASPLLLIYTTANLQLLSHCHKWKQDCVKVRCAHENNQHRQ